MKSDAVEEPFEITWEADGPSRPPRDSVSFSARIATFVATLEVGRDDSSTAPPGMLLRHNACLVGS